MEFFSDRELGKKESNETEISVSVWNGVVTVYEAYVSANCFSRDFPENCPDGHGICGCARELMEDKIRALIPSLSVPIKRKENFTTIYVDSDEWHSTSKQVETKVNTFDTLDLIEFWFNHIVDPKISGQLHEYFSHYHYSFSDGGLNKEKFRNEINQIFQRNSLVYFLDRDGKIKRTIPAELRTLLKDNFRTKDLKLNELLREASGLFVSPKFNDRLKAVEKLWDAFERVKTYYGANKKLSATQLIALVAQGNTLMEKHVNEEFIELTEIGNKFQIRHFETDKIEIKEPEHIDYLYFRMFSMIDMLIKELEK